MRLQILDVKKSGKVMDTPAQVINEVLGLLNTVDCDEEECER